MKYFITFILIILIQSPLLAKPLEGPWQVQVGGVTHRDGTFSAGETTFVQSDGKVYYSTWSSGPAGPTKDLIGTAAPATITELGTALAKLKGTKPQTKGQRSLYLEHKGKGTNYRWTEKKPPAEIQKTLEAFHAAVKSAKK